MLRLRHLPSKGDTGSSDSISARGGRKWLESECTGGLDMGCKGKRIRIFSSAMLDNKH